MHLLVLPERYSKDDGRKALILKIYKKISPANFSEGLIQQPWVGERKKKNTEKNPNTRISKLKGKKKKTNLYKDYKDQIGEGVNKCEPVYGQGQINNKLSTKERQTYSCSSIIINIRMKIKF